HPGQPIEEVNGVGPRCAPGLRMADRRVKKPLGAPRQWRPMRWFQETTKPEDHSGHLVTSTGYPFSLERSEEMTERAENKALFSFLPNALSAGQLIGGGPG